MSQSQFAVSGLPARPARTPLPRRTVHLDFHTGPDIPDVGSGFEPDAFAAAFAAVPLAIMALYLVIARRLGAFEAL